MSTNNNDIFSIEEVEKQLKAFQQDYDYTLKEYPIEVVLQKFKKDINYTVLDESVASIYIPQYQRQFVWKPEMKCKFIESLFLGVPIPPLFAFTVDDSGNMELIDGVQRLSTISAFINENLKLNSLELLDTLNGYRFKDLHPSRQRKFNSLSVRIFVFSEKADEGIRADIYNRINSTGEKLTDSEVRKGTFLGNSFYDFITECANITEFRELFKATKGKEKKLRGEKEELITRFFAYSEDYKNFEHSVKHFLNEYIIKKHKNGFDKQEKLTEFIRMLNFVKEYFPNGFRKSAGSNSIPRVRFEAIAIGVNLALQENPNLVPHDIKWLESEEFKFHTTSDASNNKNKLLGRIEFVRNCLLSKIPTPLTYSDHT